MHRIIKTVFLILTLSFITLEDVKAQFVDFGRNKVQYSDFEWYVLSTEHFKIYYYEEAIELAEMGAKYAEESYAHLQQKFNHSLIDTVPLIFYASPIHFKQTNTTPGFIPDGVGGFFEFIKGRVVIPFDGSLGQFRHVIRHELTHVFMMSKIGNVLKTHRQSADRQPPLWFTEGLAEYWSHYWDTQAEMVIKDAVLSGYIAGLDNWERFYGSYIMYKLGQKVLEFIADNFGEDKILQLMENFWVDDNFSNVMKHTIGMDYKEFDSEFLYYLKQKYYPDLLANESPTRNTDNIFAESFYAHKPAFTNANGRDEIYFIANRTGYTSIYKVPLSRRSEFELIIEGENKDEFEQFHYFRTGLDISNSGLLAFVTQKGDKDALHIYNTRTEKVLADYSFRNIVNIGAPSWSSDNNFIVFPATDFSGKSDLYRFNVKSHELKRLTNDHYDDREPSLSPNGDMIVFSSDRTSFGKKNRYNLFLYDLKSHDISYLTIGDQSDYSPHFNEDGTKIVFTSDRNGVQNIWMIDLDKQEPEIIQSGSILQDTMKSVETLSTGSGIEMRQLTNFTTGAFDPKWAGNNRIVFSTFENGRNSVRMMSDVNEKYDTANMIVELDYGIKEEAWALEKIKSIPRKNLLKYDKQFSLDIATTSLSTDPVFGTNTGGIISLSDLLGNEKYYFLIFNNSNSDTEFWKSFNIAISKVSLEKRLNYAYGIYHLSGRRYDLRDYDRSYYERLYGGYLGLSYPLSFFRRIETSVSLSQSIKSTDFLDNNRSLLLSNTISYVKDNSIWSWTGPVDGERLNFTLGYTTDIANSNLNYYSILFDFRKYIRIGRPTSLALRGQFFMNEGKEPRRFFMGGSWSLRGWSLNSMRGSKLWQANAELRFPLINILALRFPLGISMDFPGIRGALYFDAGNAWDNSDNYRETKGSLGGGIRMNVLGIVVLRYDLGKRIEKNFTKLQSGLFHQFYFGWDF
jgi:hypothetical protein